MTYVFDLELHPKQANEKTIWFTAKEKYLVRYDMDTKKFSCSCMAGTFNITGNKGLDCKHISKAKKLVRALGLE